MRGAGAAGARHVAVAGLVLAVGVEVGELIDELLTKVGGAIGARVDLVLLVAAAHAARKRGASIANPLEGWPERSLHQNTVVARTRAFATLLGPVASGDVARVLCAMR